MIATTRDCESPGGGRGCAAPIAMIARAALLVALLLPSVARAERPSLAVGVNNPITLAGGVSLSGSVYVGIAPHHAIRANVASYSEQWLVLLEHLDADVDDNRTFDAGVGYVYYPTRAFDGLSLEAGVLYRGRTRTQYGFGDFEDPTWHRETRGVVARAMVGWTWILKNRVFIAAAVGSSVGYHRGTYDDYFMNTTTPVERTTTEVEAHLRFGLALPSGTW